MSPPPADFLQALARRAALRASGVSDAIRLVDGAGDGPVFDGLYIDDFAGRWLVQTTRHDQSPPEWLRALVGGTSADAPRTIYWKRLDSRAEHQQPPVHWAGDVATEPFPVAENGLRFRIDLASGYSQGIFLDQRDNRAELRRRVGPADSVLNCFAYTCAFSVAAAAAGAHTISVDLSRRALSAGRENFRLNGLDDACHGFQAADVFEQLRRFARQGKRFRAIVLDPPTFSRDRKGKVFRVADDFSALVRMAAEVLTVNGFLYCSTNARGITAADFRRIVQAGLPSACLHRWRLESLQLPADFTGTHALQSLWCNSPI